MDTFLVLLTLAVLITFALASYSFIDRTAMEKEIKSFRKVVENLDERVRNALINATPLLSKDLTAQRDDLQRRLTALDLRAKDLEARFMRTGAVAKEVAANEVKRVEKAAPPIARSALRKLHRAPFKKPSVKSLQPPAKKR